MIVAAFKMIIAIFLGLIGLLMYHTSQEEKNIVLKGMSILMLLAIVAIGI